MTVLSPPTWTQYGTYDAKNDRMHFSGLFETMGATRVGDFTVTQSVVPSMTVNVGAGAAYFESGYASLQGYYGFINDAPITITHAPSDPVNPRIDRIVARIYDSFFQGTADEAKIEIIKGDPAVSPALPDLPLSSIELARVSIGANATTVVTANINNSVMPLAAFRESLINSALSASGAWIPYTPTLVATPTSPTNYTATGKYIKIGRTLIINFQVTMGASFTQGSGVYGILTPVPIVVSAVTQGTARLYDSSTGAAITGARIASNSSSTVVLQCTATYAGSLGNVANNFPWTWAAGDILDGFVILESVS